MPVQTEEHFQGSAPEALFIRDAADISVGSRIRVLRNLHGLSLKRTAELSGLNINTLSLVENGKTSPSVSTLQQLARALSVPISAFFESEPVSLQVVFTSHGKRPLSIIGQTVMENLGKDLRDNIVQPFVITLEQGAGSGEQMIVHTGHEFVYCLSGKVRYTVDGMRYFLEPGDSLVFEATLPHQWENIAKDKSQLILVFYPVDLRGEPVGRHFSN